MGLPKVNEKDCIFVVVDRLTKYAYFFAIPSDFQTAQVVNLFFREVFRLYRLPQNIVRDQDGRFISIFWIELFQLARTELSPSTSYHPQTDEKTEIVNKWLEGYLRNYVSAQQWAWANGCIWGNTITIQPITYLLGCHPSKHYTGMNPFHLSTWYWVTVAHQGQGTGFNKCKTS